MNGKVLESPAFTVEEGDRIFVDGEELGVKPATKLWLYHKPAGLMTTARDPQGRPTVFENLPKQIGRVISVGRLDLNSEGLLLITNDGALARKLELPATGLVRQYRVRVHGTVDEKKLAELKNGITVEGVTYGSIEAAVERYQTSNAWLIMTLKEGKNREIRKVMSAINLSVNRLIRLRYGPYELGGLERGDIVEADPGLVK